MSQKENGQMSLDATMEHGLVMAWEMSPLMVTRGAEVFQNLRKGPEQGDLDHDYKKLRAQLIDDNFAFVGAMGPNKAGKGSTLMGILRTARQDQFLKHELAQKGLHLVVDAAPFVHATLAARLPNIGLIPSHLTPATFDSEHTFKASRLQWHIIDKHVLPKGATTKEEVTAAFKEQGIAVLMGVEASTQLVVPQTSKVPVMAFGTQDLGNSTLYNLLVDPRIRDNTHVYYIKRGKDLTDDKSSSDFRVQASAQEKNIDIIFKGDIRVIVTLPDGTEVHVEDLPNETQVQLATILGLSMASPAAMEKLDAARESLIADLYKQGVIAYPTEEAVVDYTRRILGVNENQLAIIDNPQFRGHKTYDLDYITHNVIVRGHRGIFEGALQNALAPTQAQEKTTAKPEQSTAPDSIAEETPDLQIVSDIKTFFDALVDEYPIEDRKPETEDEIEKRNRATQLIRRGTAVIQEWIENPENNEKLQQSENGLFKFPYDPRRAMEIRPAAEDRPFVFIYSDDRKQKATFMLENDHYSLFIDYPPEAEIPSLIFTRGEETIPVPVKYSPAGPLDSIENRDAQLTLHLLADFISRVIEEKSKGTGVPYDFLFLKHNRGN